MLRFSFAFFILFLCGAAFVHGGNLGTFREVDKVSDPRYLKRSDSAWDGKCRLVGTVKNAPEKYEIQFFKKGSEKLFYAQAFDGRMTVYESYWLPAGNYVIVIKAEGFTAFKIIKGVDLKASTDCVLDITFGTTVYQEKN